MNFEDREYLLDLLQQPGFELLMHQIGEICASLEGDVLKLDLTSTNHLDFIIKKARAEGARRLESALSLRLEKLKSKSRAETNQ